MKFIVITLFIGFIFFVIDLICSGPQSPSERRFRDEELVRKEVEKLSRKGKP